MLIINIKILINIEALKGSCVRIPCSFTLGSIKAVDYDPCLKTHSCNAIWMRGGTDKTNTVGSSPSGNLNQKDCTTILDNMPTGDKLYFRLECGNCLVTCLSILDTPPTPTLTPATVEVREGTSVSLICSAAAPCPSLHPTLTWTPSLGQSEEGLQENQDKTQVKTSSLTFTASYLHHEQNISCTALYKQQDGKNIIWTFFSTSYYPSGSVLEGSSMTLTCSGNANPAVSYTWYRVNGVQVTSIGHGNKHQTQVYTDHRQFYCGATNDHGTKNSSVIELDVLCTYNSGTIVSFLLFFTCLFRSSQEHLSVSQSLWFSVRGQLCDSDLQQQCQPSSEKLHLVQSQWRPCDTNC
uniref:Ig-like domain-containing protein n=1 Tax=Oncorhynchus mykiss TaxID=8022 RepID=A0A8C7SFG0_ONCMY